MRLRRSSSLAVVTALLGLSAAAGVAAAPAAVAATAPKYQVTFVARVCSTYAEIMANRARNNIQESLRDLGKDTVYTSGQPVSPTIEAPNNPACTPLDGWQFRLGTGIKGKTPATDYLSTVTGDYGQTITVAPTTPELDAQGQTTGRTLQDAVTVTLTDAQAQRAQQGSSLWTQGGTTTDPLLNGLFPGQYGFGALRCSIDNLNGDNVEWIGFPSGSKHVFCYYYAVKPPPSAGTIVVRKSLATGTNGPAQFRYVGNISYTATNDFTLTPASDTASASETFIRAAGDSWDFEEQATSGFALVSLTCEETKPPEVGEASSWVVTGAKAVVKVGDGATVVCTYVNRDVPPPTGRLRLSKVTFGATGTFPFKITDPSGTSTKYAVSTKAEGVQTVVAETPSSTPGTWKVRETLPAATSRGSWTATSVQCNGADVAFSTAPGADGTTLVTASRAVASRETVDCVFGNTFTPGGQIVLDKRTSGGVGTFAFPVLRLDQLSDGATPTDLFTAYEATTTSEGVVTAAAPTAGRRSLTHLPVDDGDASTYVIGELSPPATIDASWSLTTVTCTDLSTDTVVPTIRIGSLAAVQVELTTDHPRLRCVFDNELVATGGVATDSAVLVTKTIKGNDAGHQGAVVLRLTCADGTTGTFRVAAGATGTHGTEAPFIVPDGTACTLTETSTGANSSAELTSTTMQAGTGALESTTSISFRTDSAAPLTVVVVDVYGGLAPSGAGSSTGITALAGLLLLASGLALVLAARRSIG
jgi:hypothetical protein